MKMQRRFSHLTRLFLVTSILVDSAASAPSTGAVGRSIHPLNPILFTVQAINPELTIAPARPELKGGVTLKSEINNDANHDKKSEDLNGRAPIEILKAVIAGIVANQGIPIDELAVQEQVNELHGYGMNEVDHDLMSAYFQEIRRVLIIRELMFVRGEELAEQGMKGSGAIFEHPGETPAEAIERFRLNVERWHRWSLAYGEAYKRDHPGADEINIKGDGRTDKDAFAGVGKTITDEINEDIFGPMLRDVDTIRTLIKNDEIHPDKVTLRLSRFDPPGQVDIPGRSARVGFLPMKGDPWQFGHIYMMVAAMAQHKLDVVVFGEDNSDPYRKKGLSSLTIRKAVAKYLIKILMPFFRNTTIFVDEADLRDKDGDRSIFRLMELNRGLNIHWFYMAGSDHRHWDKTQKKEEKTRSIRELQDAGKSTTMEKGYEKPIYDQHYDVPRKEWYFTQIAKPDGYQGEPLSIIFSERRDDKFEPGWRETIETLSGIPILTVIQTMLTSSTRNRVHHHWWTGPYDVFAMAAAIRFWGAENASQVAESVLTEVLGTAESVRAAHAVQSGGTGLFEAA